MKDKEMIEEMFQDTARVMCDCEDKERFFKPHRYECRNCYMHTVIQHIVFFLRNSDYEKLPKDSVVLSREEYNETLEQFRQEIITLSQELVNSRKETVEKFAKMVYATLTNRKVWVDMHNWWLEGKECPPLKKILNELSKQFGVEIKE